jgi:hypothetical protein
MGMQAALAASVVALAVWGGAPRPAASVAAAPVGQDGAAPLATPVTSQPLAQPAPPLVLLLDPGALNALRDATAAGAVPADGPELAALRRAADRGLAAGPYSVVDKTAMPPSGDPHDYYSVGPYWWPNPDTPDGLPYVQRDGEFNPRFRDNTYDFAALDQMTKSVGTLAVAYYVTDDERYAEHAARLIRTWFLDPATRMNPHLRYSQTIPGRPGERGTGIVDGRQLIAVTEAAALLAGSPAWSDADRAALRAWFGALLSWLQESAPGQEEARAPNNHATWYAAQVGAYALFAGEDALAWQMVAERGPALIADQIAPDGRQPHELARTRPFHYSVFNLEALAALAGVGSRLNVNLWQYQTADGRGIRVALDYLVPFATGAAPWPFADHDLDSRELAPLLARASRVYPGADYAARLPAAFPDATPLQRLYLRLSVWWTRG